MRNLKNIVLSSIISLTILPVSAQITFENSYPNDNLGISIAHPIKLENGLIKYRLNYYDSSKIYLYNLDHSLYKIINVPSQSGPWYNIFYLTQKLFDLDNGFEYILADGISKIIVYDEDGTMLFMHDTASIAFSIWGSNPIFNTDQGTKMRIQDNVNSVTKIYGLLGTLLTGKTELENYYYNNFSTISNSYPNPSKGNIRIDYMLPQGANQADIVFYTIEGKLVKKIKIDNTQNFV